MIYLACFALSTLFAFWANKTDKRWKFWLFSVLCIALPVLLAGLRGFNIGIDTENYLTFERFWAGAMKADSLIGYLQYYLSLGLREPLFALFIGSIARLTGEYRVFLFLAHLIIMTGIYIGAVRQRKHVNPALVLLIFYLFFFNHSLNIIRQYIAIAIIFAVFADIQEKKYWRYCVAVLVSMFIHSTSVIAFGALILHFLLEFEHPKLRLTRLHRKWIITGALSAVILLFAPIVRLLMSTGILSSRYEFFLRQDDVTPALIISGIVVLGLIAVYVFKDAMRARSPQFDFFTMSSIVYLIILQLTWTVAFGKRVALYFAMTDILTIGLIESAQTDKKKRWLVRIAIVGVALAYWLYVYAFRNASQTIPYELSF